MLDSYSVHVNCFEKYCIKTEKDEVEIIPAYTNTTRKLQPLDLGINHLWKNNYENSIFFINKKKLQDKLWQYGYHKFGIIFSRRLLKIVLEKHIPFLVIFFFLSLKIQVNILFFLIFCEKFIIVLLKNLLFFFIIII